MFHSRSVTSPPVHPFTAGGTGASLLLHGFQDRAVDACYRSQAFHSDRERVEFLFALYEKLTSPLTAGLKQPKRPRTKKQSGSN